MKKENKYINICFIVRYINATIKIVTERKD